MKGIKIFIGCVFIGGGFLFAVSLGGRIIVCIDMIRAAFLGIGNMTVALMYLSIALSLLIISFSLLICGFLYSFGKTFRASFLFSVLCLGFGVIIGGILLYILSLPNFPFVEPKNTIYKYEPAIKKELQVMRIMIENYHQENGKYPFRIDDKIFHTYFYWFKWNNIPGKDNERLIKYLKWEIGLEKIKWGKNPKIEKRDDNTIMVTDNKKVVMLKLNKEYDHSVIIELNNKQISGNYIRKEDDWKVGWPLIRYILLPDHPISNKIIYVKTKPNQKIQPHQITDEGGWIYSPDSGDIRINCSHKDSKGVPYYEW